MSWRPPDILQVLADVPLRNGNVHRLQVVRFGAAPHGVVLLEVRELIHPENLRGCRPPPDFEVEGPDGDAWGAARTKGLRLDHLEWLLEHGDETLTAMRSARSKVTES